ncbi:MAG: peptidase dimerization domain-containing protein [Pseudonocardiaceae bacterium]
MTGGGTPASHSGGSTTTSNAIEKTAHLIRVLSTAELPDGATPEFPLPGKLTVTAIQGGQSYSITPDLCTLNVDTRTTPRIRRPGRQPAAGTPRHRSR